METSQLGRNTTSRNRLKPRPGLISQKAVFRQQRRTLPTQDPLWLFPGSAVTPNLDFKDGECRETRKLCAVLPAERRRLLHPRVLQIKHKMSARSRRECFSVVELARARIQSNASGNSFGPLGNWNNRLSFSLCSGSAGSNSLRNSTPYMYLAIRAPTW